VVSARVAAALVGPAALDGQSLTVVGVLDRTLTAPDRFAIVSIEDARVLWVAKDPLLRTALASGGLALTAADLNTGAAVGWRDGEDPDAVALRIRDQVAGVNVQIPSELSRMLRGSTAFFSALIVGIAVLVWIGASLTTRSPPRVRHPRLRREAPWAPLMPIGGDLKSPAVTRRGARGRPRPARSVQMARDGRSSFLASTPGALVFSVLLGALAASYATLRIARVSPAEAIRRGA
jgi:hypothetical protein